MKKSQDVISSARNSYQKRLSLVINDYQLKDRAKRDVYLTDTPQFKKRHQIFKNNPKPKHCQPKQHQMSIQQNCISSPFQIQSHLDRCQRARQRDCKKEQKVIYKVVSPRTTQEILPTSKPKAIISVDDLIQNRNPTLKLNTSPQKINRNFNYHDTKISTNRQVLTQRLRTNIPQSPLKRLSNAKVKINHQINKISKALNKCQQSLSNLFPEKQRISNIGNIKNRKKNMMQRELQNYYNPQMFTAQKYLYSAQR